MDHFYEPIAGWFDWPELYREWAHDLPDGATIVEIGTFKGRSLAYLGVEVANSGRDRQIFAVDTWKGSPEINDPDRDAGRLWEVFADNVLHPLQREGVDVHAYRMESVRAAIHFEDESVDAVFVDGAHDSPSVLADLQAWWPKVKPGGQIAGHDFDWPTVRSALLPWAFSQGLMVEQCERRSWRIRRKPSIHAPQLETPHGRRRALVTLVCNEKFMLPEMVDSLVDLAWGDAVTKAAQANGFEWIRFRREHSAVRVDDMRDIAVMAAKRAQATHLVFLDADHVWQPDLLEKLLAHHDKGIVSGMYFRRKYPHRPVAYRSLPDDEQLPGVPRMYRDVEDVHEYRGSGVLLPVDAIGMGCALIPMSVFEHLDFPRPWFLYTRDIQGTHAITEDMHFCQGARRLGYPVLVDPSIPVEHLTSVRIGWGNWAKAKPQVEAAMAEARAKHEAANLAATGRVSPLSR